MSLIITGADGPLGFAITSQIAALCPSRYHFILTASDPNYLVTERLTQALHRVQQPFTWEALDLASLESVRQFNQRARERKIAGIVHAAVHGEFSTTKTVDGFDRVYQINTLSLFLIISELSSVMVPGARVILPSSKVHEQGEIDYFWREPDPTEKSKQCGSGCCSKAVALKRFASARALLVAAGYALQAEDEFDGKIQIASVDLGDSLGECWFPVLVRACRTVMGIMTPLIQCLDKYAGSYLESPGKAIARIFDSEADISGVYFQLDRPGQSLPETRDVALQHTVLKRLRADCGV